MRGVTAGCGWRADAVLSLVCGGVVLVADDGKILFLDVHSEALRKAGQEAPLLYSEDGLHFSARGSKDFARALYELGRAIW